MTIRCRNDAGTMIKQRKQKNCTENAWQIDEHAVKMLKNEQQ